MYLLSYVKLHFVSVKMISFATIDCLQLHRLILDLWYLNYYLVKYSLSWLVVKGVPKIAIYFLVFEEVNPMIVKEATIIN